MENKFARKVLAWCLIMLGVAVAYSGLLLPGLLIGALAAFVATVDEFKVIGDEEESDEEEL